MYVGWPQLIYLILAGISLGIHAALHGEDRKHPYDFGSTLFGESLLILLLWWGGFFGK